MFVDYCGQTLPIVDAATGEIKDAQVFVAVMGASNYTFAEATSSQALPDWIGSHVRAFSFMGAVAKCLVPDNLLSGVTKACRYEPDLNTTYAAMAEHYQTAVIPARVRRPKDKSKVEVGVQIVQRFILRLCAIEPSSVSLKPMPPSVSAWRYSTTAPSASSLEPGSRVSMKLTCRPCSPCRKPPMSTPSGLKRGCTSTITSRLMSISIVCRTVW